MENFYSSFLIIDMLDLQKKSLKKYYSFLKQNCYNLKLLKFFYFFLTKILIFSYI